MTREPHGFGLRTGLAGYGAATHVEVAADHSVVVTPSRPDYWDGNALYLHAPPGPEDVAGWVERFHTTFPAAEHLEVWWEDEAVPDGADVAERESAWLASTPTLRFQRLRVMALQELVPSVAAPDAELLRASHPKHWAGIKALHLNESVDKDRDFAEWRMQNVRADQEAGLTDHWVAYRRGIPVGTVSICHGREDLSVVDGVITHPAHRGIGIATALVHAALMSELNTRPDVAVSLLTDDGSDAQRLYRRLGFTAAGVVWVLLHPAPGTSAP